MLRRAVLVLVLSAVPGGAQRPPGDSVSRWVDSIFAPFASPQSPGCAVGVRQRGSVVLAKGYGMADLEHDTWITPETPFYIASMSKQFTAMSIVLLASDGRLSLDDSIRKWVPEVPSFGTTITLRHLLHHTSGLRDYFTLLAVSGWPSDGQLTTDQFLSLLGRQERLNFAPGDEFLYSNTGYALLSIVVQRASGLSLRDFAARRIFRPLGMTHTEFRDDHTLLIPQRALGYQPEGSTYRISQPQFDVVGDGGVYSTVDDLAKWDANFETGRVGGKDGIANDADAGTTERRSADPIRAGAEHRRISRTQDLLARRVVRRLSQLDGAVSREEADGHYSVQHLWRARNTDRTDRSGVPGNCRREKSERGNSWCVIELDVVRSRASVE